MSGDEPLSLLPARLWYGWEQLALVAPDQLATDERKRVDLMKLNFNNWLRDNDQWDWQEIQGFQSKLRSGEGVRLWGWLHSRGPDGRWECCPLLGLQTAFSRGVTDQEMQRERCNVWADAFHLYYIMIELDGTHRKGWGAPAIVQLGP